MAIGCQKHAKTESYREYLVYLQGCNEQFIEAPGIRGMVMLVFTLPGFDRVFKVIKDKFAPQKEMSAAHVRACYQLVKEHDRVAEWRTPRSLKTLCWRSGIFPGINGITAPGSSGKNHRSRRTNCDSPSLY
ncbi:bifunctional isocitrate dehydrogenase kinase/phosphatase [Escherichia coli]|nr:isocitrate dehydrogenase kinase/phosphatase-domain containing protein [Escherichia coli]MDG5898284.1 bifunctional isocitrate dehydrogenase kinase/phosphatase [Escherichia coli]